MITPFGTKNEREYYKTWFLELSLTNFYFKLFRNHKYHIGFYQVKNILNK